MRFMTNQGEERTLEMCVIIQIEIVTTVNVILYGCEMLSLT